jgi:RHS repeat-associated protein
MTIAGTSPVNYGYTFDDANRLRTITQGSTMVALDYDLAGRRKTVTLPNQVVVTYGYDAASRVKSISGVKDGTTLLDLTYAYDAAGNRVQQGGFQARTSLPTAVAATSIEYDSANQIRRWANVMPTYVYDANGNPEFDGSQTYTWNVRGQLVGISQGATPIASFEYDGFGRRYLRSINEAVTTFLYDRRNRLKTAQSGTVSLMVSGPKLDDHFACIDGTAVTSFLVDALGSTVALTDGTGAVTAEYKYEPYGATTKVTGAGVTDLLFTGRESDGNGLYQYRARYYSPKLHRFLSVDPLMAGQRFSTSHRRFLARAHRDPRELHAYLYALDSPILLTDPTGERVPGPAGWGLEALEPHGDIDGNGVVDGLDDYDSDGADDYLDDDVDGDGIPNNEDEELDGTCPPPDYSPQKYHQKPWWKRLNDLRFQ